MRKKMNQPKSQKVPLRPNDKTAEAKLQAVSDTLGMSEEAQAAYCREQGLYTHHLEAWKEKVLAGLTPINHKADKVQHQRLSLENKQLKSELHRKEKALAEASALLILKKKANLIWGDSEED